MLYLTEKYYAVIIKVFAEYSYLKKKHYFNNVTDKTHILHLEELYLGDYQRSEVEFKVHVLFSHKQEINSREKHKLKPNI